MHVPVHGRPGQPHDQRVERVSRTIVSAPAPAPRVGPAPRRGRGRRPARGRRPDDGSSHTRTSARPPAGCAESGVAPPLPWRASIAASTLSSNSRQSTCGAARRLPAIAATSAGSVTGHGAARHVRLVVAVLRRERVQRVAPVALEVAPLRRVDHEAEQPLVGDDRRDRVDPRAAVGADGGQVAQAGTVLLQQGADRRRPAAGSSAANSDQEAMPQSYRTYVRERSPKSRSFRMLLSDRDLVTEIKSGALDARAVRARAGAAVQHRRTAGPALPGLQQPPLHAHRPGRCSRTI